MERRSRLVLFGVGVVIVALIYLLYQAAGRSLRTPGATGMDESAIEDDAENPAPPPRSGAAAGDCALAMR